MKRTSILQLMLAAGAVGLVFGRAGWADDSVGTRAKQAGPLAEYVAKPDASYAWTEKRQGQVGGTRYVELRLTSQTWRGIPWKHQLYLLKPSTASPDAKQGLLFIAGGSWRDELDDPSFEPKIPGEAQLLSAVAEQLKSPVAILLQVPHQPLFDGKREDDAISYTFEQYLKTGEQDWPLLLPMVKSAVRAMDATQEYAQEKWSIDVQHFTVTGASKRGWTTWLTGATDPRATAIAPMVIDTLNMPAQMKHQIQTWGEFSEQIEDYTRRGLQKQLGSSEGSSLTRIVDPYSYRERLTQSKLLIFGTNDRYWTLDACNLYWDDLSGEKHLLYVPNQGHGIKDYPRIIGALCALHQEASGGPKLPDLKWQYENGDKQLRLHVASDQKPKQVQVWTASSSTRDFRNAEWTSTAVEASGDGYDYALDLPATGYRAVFGEAAYDHGAAPTLYLSTTLRIVSSERMLTAAE